MPRSRTIWKDGQLFAEYVDGKLTWLNPDYQPPARSDVVKAPMVMRDIGEYTSVIDGTNITSRSQHRDHMRAHDVIEVGNEWNTLNRVEHGPSKYEIGRAIKDHLEEVKAAPQHAYENHIHEQRAEHESIASLVTATA